MTTSKKSINEYLIQNKGVLGWPYAIQKWSQLERSSF